MTPTFPSTQPRGVRSGFGELDQLTGDLQPGQLIFIASRYSMGKTALALNIAEYVAVHEDLPVAIFCLESCTADLKKRLARTISGIGVRGGQTGPLHGGKLHIEVILDDTSFTLA